MWMQNCVHDWVDDVRTLENLANWGKKENSEIYKFKRL